MCRAKIDALVIITQPWFHAAQAVQAMEHGGSHACFVHEFVDAVVHDHRPAMNAREAARRMIMGVMAHKSPRRDGNDSTRRTSVIHPVTSRERSRVWSDGGFFAGGTSVAVSPDQKAVIAISDDDYHRNR